MTKVEMLYPQGYCAGVKNAINIAKSSRENYPNNPIYILGYLVHNKQVTDSFEQLDIKTLYSNNGDYTDIIKELEDDTVIIFPAHGHDEKYDEIAKDKGLIILDAVCPKVKQNSSIIKKELNEGHQVIYIGIGKHPETAASLSLGDNVLLFDIYKEFDYSSIKDDSPLVINQTTLNYLELTNVHNDIKNHIPNARFQNEICNSTRTRQERIVNLDEDVDMIVIVGDKASSNTNRLVEIAKSSHPNARCLLVSNINQLDKNEIVNKKHIVISSGASTPTETINMIYEEIINSFAK